MQPFSFGPRNCIGRKWVTISTQNDGMFLLTGFSSLAFVEMRIILARMIFNFDMELDPCSDGWTNQDAYGLWDKPDLMVKVTPRKNVQ